MASVWVKFERHHWQLNMTSGCQKNMQGFLRMPPVCFHDVPCSAEVLDTLWNSGECCGQCNSYGTWSTTNITYYLFFLCHWSSPHRTQVETFHTLQPSYAVWFWDDWLNPLAGSCAHFLQFHHEPITSCTADPPKSTEKSRETPLPRPTSWVHGPACRKPFHWKFPAVETCSFRSTQLRTLAGYKSEAFLKPHVGGNDFPQAGNSKHHQTWHFCQWRWNKLQHYFVFRRQCSYSWEPHQFSLPISKHASSTMLKASSA